MLRYDGKIFKASRIEIKSGDDPIVYHEVTFYFIRGNLIVIHNAEMGCNDIYNVDQIIAIRDQREKL